MTHLKITERINYEAMPRLKAYHTVTYGDGFTQRNYHDLEAYANVDDVSLKRAPKTTQEGAARDMIAAIERAEQIAIEANPPRYCKAFVERSDYPIMSLYSDYKDLIEESTLLFMLRLHVFGNAAWSTLRDVVTWADYHAERKKWRKCAYKFCLNVFPTDKTNFKTFPAKRKDTRYCDDQCKNGAHNAERDFKRTGSYMPEWYWLPRLSESVGDAIRDREVASNAEDVQTAINKRIPIHKAGIKDDIAEVARSLSGEVVTYKNIEEAEKAYVQKGVKI